MLLTCTDFAKNAKNWAILPFMTSQNDISASKFSKKCHYGTGASFWAQKRNILLYASFSSCFCNSSKVNSQKQSILAKIGTFVKKCWWRHRMTSVDAYFPKISGIACLVHIFFLCTKEVYWNEQIKKFDLSSVQTLVDKTLVKTFIVLPKITNNFFISDPGPFFNVDSSFLCLCMRYLLCIYQHWKGGGGQDLIILLQIFDWNRVIPFG